MSLSVGHSGRDRALNISVLILTMWIRTWAQRPARWSGLTAVQKQRWMGAIAGLLMARECWGGTVRGGFEESPAAGV